ncbi:MAG TPA: hypothetical protein VGO93_11800, partial [Candidatus Xenobia bacterium]
MHIPGHGDVHAGRVDRDHDWHGEWHDSHDWCHDRWGDDWGHRGYGWGFYSGSSFWLGYDMGLAASWDWADQPVYVVSPITGGDCGQVPPPNLDSGYSAQDATYLSLLQVMAAPQQDQNNPDPTAGLYYQSQLDPQNPTPDARMRLSAAAAFNALNDGTPLVFHPPNGDFETLAQKSDLNAYLYQQTQAPP